MTYLGEPWSSGEKTHVQEVVGLNPSTGIWMDIFQTNLKQWFYCLFEKTKNRQKRGWGWHILKQTDVPREDKIGQGCATPRQSR